MKQVALTYGEKYLKRNFFSRDPLVAGFSPRFLHNGGQTRAKARDYVLFASTSMIPHQEERRPEVRMGLFGSDLLNSLA